MTFGIDAFVRIAGATILNFFAFGIWNIGTRPPLQALVDIGRGVRTPRSLAIGFIRIAAGLLFFVAAVVIVHPVVRSREQFSVIAILTILVALTCEYLVGDDLRALFIARNRRLT